MWCCCLFVSLSRTWWSGYWKLLLIVKIDFPVLTERCYTSYMECLRNSGKCFFVLGALTSQIPGGRRDERWVCVTAPVGCLSEQFITVWTPSASTIWFSSVSVAVLRTGNCVVRKWLSDNLRLIKMWHFIGTMKNSGSVVACLSEISNQVTIYTGWKVEGFFNCFTLSRPHLLLTDVSVWFSYPVLFTSSLLIVMMVQVGR